MKGFFLTMIMAGVATGCSHSGEGPAADPADSNVSSTTPPPNKDTNAIGIMMGDTTVGLNDSLKKDSTLP